MRAGTTIKELYEQYWEERRHRINDADFGPDEILEGVESALDGAERLLDVGCGIGNLIGVAHGRCGAVHGCDVSEVAVHEACGRGVIGVCADLNCGALPYRSGAFDWATCLEVIEHVVDPLQLLRELHRVLRPAGRLILTTPNIRYFRNVARLVWRGEFPHTTTDTFVWGGGHLHYFTRRDLSGLLVMAGFEPPRFLINARQFERSWKRRVLARIIGLEWFGEWICGGILAVARKP
ncbi:MAG TPA: class I SAM-dependent methyltransferase [Methylomirabilota bacterium]|jgi:2-polyprenyl-3-methyl-5-hydroxy-6-metoxy-1,4-benzoquinol methylase|nr:class I SAM-dependent methyltransferase [Methylomirabilota bacterium]